MYVRPDSVDGPCSSGQGCLVVIRVGGSKAVVLKANYVMYFKVTVVRDVYCMFKREFKEVSPKSFSSEPVSVL